MQNNKKLPYHGENHPEQPEPEEQEISEEPIVELERPTLTHIAEEIRSRKFTMSWAYLVDKWLNQLDWLLYAAFPFFCYAVALNAGHLQNWSEFLFTTLAGLVLVSFIYLLKRKT